MGHPWAIVFVIENFFRGHLNFIPLKLRLINKYSRGRQALFLQQARGLPMAELQLWWAIRAFYPGHNDVLKTHLSRYCLI
jgi:hypothetical protein